MQRPCPACGQSTEHRALFVKNGCHILQCAACGLGRAEATNFDPGQYYTGDYFSGRRADGYAVARRRQFAVGGNEYSRGRNRPDWMGAGAVPCETPRRTGRWTGRTLGRCG